MSIFNKAINLFKFDCEIMLESVPGTVNQPLQSNEGEVSCSRKQREPLRGFKLMSDQLRDRRVT